ncbi:MAG TPA: FG-GAP-like repeat-containing protein [Vicinamibacterales bacterium]|nr:VCBS repeat-containing protein [Acidobacteriota bacterium]HOC17804.1 FG-GAP-like repeat-containing protein [Vicinamibacterales bacterium]
MRCVAAFVSFATLASSFAASSSAQTTDRIYFPAVQNVRSVLVAAIRAETVRIDMAAWLLTERMVSTALRDAFRRGVQVRLIGDRVALFETDPLTRNEFYWLASQGVPIRVRTHPRSFPEIAHWKAAIFKGQRLVSFGSANYTPNQLAPASEDNYSDETVLFTTDPSLVGAFLTKFDAMWNDTTPEPESRGTAPPYLLNWDEACGLESACSSYRSLYPAPAPMLVNTARLEPDRPMPAGLVWGQGASFNNRLAREIANEERLVRFVVYRLTSETVTRALVEKARSGVPVRLIVEPAEYLNRRWPEFWLTHANLDRLWAAGVRIRQRRHAGLTHMKMLVTSRYATNASSNVATNWQRDHNYFVPAATKPAAHQAMAARFDQMWNDAEAFEPFVPGPPDQPRLAAPQAGASGVVEATALSWRAAPFATSYDVYLGPSPAALSPVARVAAQMVNDPPATYSWAPPAALSPGQTLFWKVVARTNATGRDPSLVRDSGAWSFTTLGAAADARRSRPTVFRRSNGRWYIQGRADSIRFGAASDVPVHADYDGDGVLDAAVWRPSSGTWFILRSAGSPQMQVQWGSGNSRDVPLPADYDGDGRADLAVWRPATGTWFILRSSGGYQRSSALVVRWGAATDQPVPADYDGDGRADLAVWRPGTGTWWILTSTSGFRTEDRLAVAWGSGRLLDVPVPADYDGDGRADLAVWRPGTGTWWILQSADGYSADAQVHVRWGLGSLDDVPVPADYDGDGRADLAVWRPGPGTWYFLWSATGYSTWSSTQWGVRSAGDVPVLAGWAAMQSYLR